MFGKRLASGIVLLAVMVGSFILGGLWLWSLIVIISMIGYHELVKALASVTQLKYKPRPAEFFGMCGVVLYDAALYFHPDRTYALLAIAVFLLAELFLYVFRFPKEDADEITQAVFAFLYCPAMLSFIFLTREIPEHGKYAVWLILISSWGCDTCAYCVGKLIGKHKMSPILSPKKSIEGAIGGVAGSAIIGAVFAAVLFSRKYPDISLVLGCALICGLGALISMVGDLAASAIKRDKNLKDYGNLIPGHGGIMDRFDSVIFTAPATYFLAVVIFEASRIMR
jgi:phosphatidate cytidylyltransferase